MNDFEIIKNPHECTPLSIRNAHLRVDWYNAGEGFYGDYNPEDPGDVNLLRFDAYYRQEGDRHNDPEEGWVAIDNASYCTLMPATAPAEILERSLRYIFNQYHTVIKDIPYSSVKRIGEGLSWIGMEDFTN